MSTDFKPTSAVNFQPEHGAPARTPFSGTHFSNSDISGGVINGALRGSSPESSDAYRVHLTPSAPAGVHAVRAGHLAHPSIHGRQFAHKVSGDHAIADIDQSPGRELWSKAFQDSFHQSVQNGIDPVTAKATSMNQAEHAVKAAGHTGYEASKHQPGQVLIFGDVPITT